MPDGRADANARQVITRVGIRQLRNDVAAVVRRAAAGERIIVTLDGVPTAQIGPVRPDDSGRLSLDDLVAAGLALPPARPRVATRSRRDQAADLDVEDVPVDINLDAVIEELRGSR